MISWRNHRKPIPRHFYKQQKNENVPNHKGALAKYAGSAALYIREFFQQTTIQGFQYLNATNRHPLETLLWAVSIVLTSVGAITLVLGSWERYLANPTVVSVEKDYQNWDTLFPAITMCYIDNVNQTRVEEQVQKFWGTVDTSKKRYYVDYLRTVASASLRNLHLFNQYENDSTLIYTGNLEALAIEIQIDLQYHISFMDESSRVSMRPTLTEMGLCFTWGSNISHLFGTRKASLPEDDEKLVTRCRYVDLPCGIRIFDLLTALKFYIHPTDDMPIEGRSKNYTELRGYEREIFLEYKQIVASPELRRLTPEQRGCLFQDEVEHQHPSSRLPHFSVYSYNFCKMACRIRLAKKLCGCIPFFYRTLDDSEKICDNNGMVCLSKYQRNLTEEIHNKKSGCHCYHQCEIMDYTIMSEDTYNLTSAYDDVTQQTIQFYVGIDTFTKTRYRRDVIFSFEDLLVSFGGTVSLFLGCSILSGVELIYFFTLRLGCVLWMKRQEKTKPGTSRGQRSHREIRSTSFWNRKWRPNYIP